MTKFRVTTREPGRTVKQSLDYPDERAVLADAQRALTEMVREHVPKRKRGNFKVQVNDETGQEVYSAALGFSAKTKSQPKT